MMFSVCVGGFFEPNQPVSVRRTGPANKAGPEGDVINVRLSDQRILNDDMTSLQAEPTQEVSAV